jgi:hypothetical protein
MITPIINSFKEWLNKREQLKRRAKYTSLYLDSVGKQIFSDNGFGEGVRNKDKYAKPVWNKRIKPLTQYEMMQRTLSENS